MTIAIIVLASVAAVYVVHVISGYISEKRYRRRMEDKHGPIRWGEGELVSALKLTGRLPEH